jgi:sulfatase modifying factor 1
MEAVGRQEMSWFCAQDEGLSVNLFRRSPFMTYLLILWIPSFVLVVGGEMARVDCSPRNQLIYRGNIPVATKEATQKDPSSSNPMPESHQGATARIRADSRGPTGAIFVNSVGMKFVLIPPGNFMMGAAPHEMGQDPDEQPQHLVEISKPFYMQTTEVTQNQWAAVMGDNPSFFSDCGGDCPVEQVSWEDSQRFIRALNEREKTDRYRLPSEAEWEYACRAGTTTPFAFGDTLSTEQANYDGNYPYSLSSLGVYGSLGAYRRKTVSVGRFPPNSWGLGDMHGNVWEWCQDWYGSYQPQAVTDPTGPVSGLTKVIRGGGWNYFGRLCRSSFRSNNLPSFAHSSVGFRVVRGLNQTQRSPETARQ